MSETPGSLLTSPVSVNLHVKEVCDQKPKDPAKIKEEREAEFQLVEYREAANAYFKGVEIGYTGLKGYITINVLFATALGLLVNPNASSILGVTDVGRLVPSFALLASLGFVLTFPHYFNHLENCRMRCQKLESDRGGLLFTGLGQVASQKYTVGAISGAILIIIAPAVLLWLFLAIRLRSFPYIWSNLRSMFS